MENHRFSSFVSCTNYTEHKCIKISNFCHIMIIIFHKFFTNFCHQKTQFVTTKRIQIFKIRHFWLNWMQCAYVRFCKLDSWSNNDVDNDIFNFSLDRPRPVITRDFGKVREHSQTVWIGRFWGGFPKFTITHAICIVKLFKEGIGIKKSPKHVPLMVCECPLEFDAQL